jgi:hypothetical protein
MIESERGLVPGEIGDDDDEDELLEVDEVSPEGVVDEESEDKVDDED